VTARTTCGTLTVLLAAAMISTTCRGNHNSMSSGTVLEPTPPPREMVGRLLGFEVEPQSWVSFRTDEITRPGTLDVVVPYGPFPGAYVQIFLFDSPEKMNACNPKRPSHEICPDTVPGATGGMDQNSQPQRLVAHVTAGSRYYIMVRNRGPATATGRGEAGLTPDR
jgi:hypothetical protein